MRVLITGATGLVGRQLIYQLQISGHTVLALARSPQNLPELPSANVFAWQGDENVPVEALKGTDVVVHLAGENVAAQRWTEKRKQALKQSRIGTTQNILKAIAALSPKLRPKNFIAASAIGFYGPAQDRRTEDSPAGNDFLATLCVDWEKAIAQAEPLGLRTVIMRLGLVLSKQGGFCPKLDLSLSAAGSSG